jgi:CheY-like chemotaxis protein
MKILIVEDEYDMQVEIIKALTQCSVSLGATLSKQGNSYPVLSEDDIKVAGSRTSAYKMLEETFDLVLLDLLLPSEDGGRPPSDKILYGYDVLNLARARYPDIEVIVLSARMELAKPGFIEFKRRIEEEVGAAVPNEVLWKEPYRGDTELLQRKIASYLIDLTKADEEILAAEEIFVPPKEIPSETRKILRTLKRIASPGLLRRPLLDVVLVGEKGVGKATFARAFYLMRSSPLGKRRIAFEQVEMAPIHRKASDPLEVLLGSRGGEVWSLGAIPRTTFYTRNGAWVPLPGQEIREEKSRRIIDGVPGARLYPTSRDHADFDASGTLYVEDIFGGDKDNNAEIVNILSPLLGRRYLTTRGPSPVRLHVGSNLVLGFTNPTMLEEAQGVEQLQPLYRERIDVMEIRVPPLRERSPEERIWLLERLVNQHLASKVATGTEGAASIYAENNMSGIVGEGMFFRDNLDDLEALANRILPAERSISWHHLKKLWDRDKNLISKWRGGTK